MNLPNHIEYHPNPARAVTIEGLFGGDAVRSTLAEIKALIEQSSAPITIYIKTSGGGLLYALNDLEKLFAHQSPKTARCGFITVLQCAAHSAAAYLAVLGNYAYMEKQGRLVFHGISCADYKKGMVLTREDAASLAIRLDRENRAMAKKLAAAILPRMALRYQLLEKESVRGPKGQPDKTSPSLDRFVNQIGAKLAANKCRELVQAAQEYAGSMTWFANQCNSSSGKAGHQEAKELGLFLKRGMEECVENNWPMDELTVAEIVSDYYFFKDVPSGDLSAGFLDLCRQFGPSILRKSEREKYLLLKAKNAESAEKFLLNKSLPLLLNLRHFALALCSRLLIGQTTISAMDAYWLGLIDEIIETNQGHDKTMPAAESSP